MIKDRVETHVGHRVIWQAKQEAVLDRQLQARQLLLAMASHNNWWILKKMDHKVGSVYDWQIEHRRRLQCPLRPGLATDSALEGTEHAPRKQMSLFSESDSCLLVTRTTVSMAALDSTTTWWMYRWLWERPRLRQSDHPASLYLFSGFKP